MAHEPIYADEAAFPRAAVYRDDGSRIYYDQWGLTRREYFAIHVLAANLRDNESYEVLAKSAVKMADALLAALQAKPGANDEAK